MTTAGVEGRFTEAMIRIYDRAKRECNYNATRFLQMLGDHGAVETARLLLWSDRPSDGFTALWECGHLELTVEAHIILDEFETLFADDERARARSRLADYGWHP